MSRSERYIAPSESELQRLQQAFERAQEFDGHRTELLRTALTKSRKPDLVELALRVAQESQAAGWALEQELALQKPPPLLVHDIATAIKVATRVDHQRLDQNFDYDWRAYQAVLFGLEQLVQQGCVEEAKTLALRLMAMGSRQMECSDEGLMREEIEGCLRVVVAAVAGEPRGAEWGLRMLQEDRVGVVSEQELSELAGGSWD